MRSSRTGGVRPGVGPALAQLGERDSVEVPAAACSAQARARPSRRLQLARGLAGEGDGEDVAGVGVAVASRYAMRRVSTRVLPGAGPREDAERGGPCS